jgi:hypothetical protein
VCTLKALLELEMGLTMLMLNLLNILMMRISTSEMACDDWIITAHNCTDSVIFYGVIGTETMTVVCKWLMAVVDHTAWMSNCYPINNNHRYHMMNCSIGATIELYAFLAIMLDFRPAV